MKKDGVMAFFQGWTVIMMLLVAMPGYCRTLSQILDQGILNIGMIAENDYPFVFEDEKGKLSGFDVRLSHDIARELGVRPVIRRTAENYDQLTEMLRKGQVDLVISDYTITLKRARHILYSIAYAEIPFVVLINSVWYARNKQRGVEPLERLDKPDVTMGTVKSSALEKRLDQMFSRVQAKRFAHAGELGKALLNGEINAAFCTRLTAHFITERHKDRRLMIREEPLPGIIDRVGIGISPDACHLKFWLDEYLHTRNMPFTVEDILRRAAQPEF